MTDTSPAARRIPEAGDIVMDTTTTDTYGPRCAIGKTGFLDLRSGEFTPRVSLADLSVQALSLHV